MRRRPPLAFIFTVTLTGILSNTLVTPAIPDILDEFKVSVGSAGLLVAVGSVAGIVVAPIAGFLADRYGRRIVLTISLMIFGIFGGLAALAPNYETLLVARFLQGFGSAALVNLAVVLIGDNWSGLARTKLIGRNAAVLTIGLASMPLLSGALTELAGWRVTFGVYTVALATAAAAWVVLDGRRPASPPSAREQFSGALVVLRRPVIRASILGGLLLFIAIFGLFLTVLPIHLDEVFGLRAGARGVVISLPALTTTLASFNLARVRQRSSARAVIIFSACLIFVSYVVVGLATTLLVLIPATFLYGAAEGFFVPLLQDLTLAGSPDEHRAVVIAVWVGFSRLGQTIGPLLAGFSVGILGTAHTFIAGSGIAVLILLLGLFGPFPRSRLGESTA